MNKAELIKKYVDWCTSFYRIPTLAKISNNDIKKINMLPNSDKYEFKEIYLGKSERIDPDFFIMNPDVCLITEIERPEDHGYCGYRYYRGIIYLPENSSIRRKEQINFIKNITKQADKFFFDNIQNYQCANCNNSNIKNFSFMIDFNYIGTGSKIVFICKNCNDSIEFFYSRNLAEKKKRMTNLTQALDDLLAKNKIIEIKNVKRKKPLYYGFYKLNTVTGD